MRHNLNQIYKANNKETTNLALIEKAKAIKKNELFIVWINYCLKNSKHKQSIAYHLHLLQHKFPVKTITKSPLRFWEFRRLRLLFLTHLGDQCCSWYNHRYFIFVLSRIEYRWHFSSIHLIERFDTAVSAQYPSWVWLVNQVVIWRISWDCLTVIWKLDSI